MEVRTATDEDFADLPASAPQERVAPRHVEPADWQRFSGFVAEIFTAFGMEAGTAATDRSPDRFLHALYDATAGYEGDPKLLTTFPTECRCDADCLVGQVIEGPISFYALCEHHALPFHGFVHRRLCPARADHRPFEADPPRASALATLHVARAPRRADRGGLRRAHGAAWGRRPYRGRPSLHADARSQGGALQDGDERVARRLLRECRTCAASSSRRSAVEIPGSERERGRRMMKESRYLIVGGGLTGDAACRGIRELDPEGAIVLVGDGAASALRAATALEGALEGRRARTRSGAAPRSSASTLRARAPDRRARPGAREARDDQGETLRATRSCCSRPAAGRAASRSAATRSSTSARSTTTGACARSPIGERARRRDRRRLHRLRDRRRARAQRLPGDDGLPGAGNRRAHLPGRRSRRRSTTTTAGAASRCWPAPR